MITVEASQLCELFEEMDQFHCSQSAKPHGQGQRLVTLSARFIKLTSSQQTHWIVADCCQFRHCKKCTKSSQT